MTEPHDMQRDRELQAAAAADLGPEARPAVIQDLDVTGDDVDDIGGGCSWTNPPGPK